MSQGAESSPPQRFARWVRDERVDTGARVRRLPRILDSAEATRLLDVVGFDTATPQVIAEFATASRMAA